MEQRSATLGRAGAWQPTRERLQVEHLEYVACLVTTDGLWMDLPIIFIRGCGAT